MSKQIEQAIVRIQNKDGKIFGAGFLVCCNEVLSCSHVIADSLGISRDTTETPSGTVYLDFPLLKNKSDVLPSLIKYWDPVLDIALIELLADLPEGTKPIELEEVEDYSYCDFGVCGFPNDMGDWTYGKMLGRIEPGYIQVEAETSHRIQRGFSGGPVWHRTIGKLAGIVIASDEDNPSDKIAYIIPTSKLINIFPNLVKKQSIPAALKYACMLSFPSDSNNPLIETAVKEIEDDLNVEVSAQLKNKGVVAKPHRTAKELCESACMIMVYTYRYFDVSDPVCAQEYQAMSQLEQTRLQKLGLTRNKDNSLIISIVLRGMNKFPVDINDSRPVYDFSKYYMVSRSERRKRRDYLSNIAEIASHIVACCLTIEQNIDDPCGSCINFELPAVQDVHNLLENWTPKYVL
jgi:hypothetical protein